MNKKHDNGGLKVFFIAFIYMVLLSAVTVQPIKLTNVKGLKEVYMRFCFILVCGTFGGLSAMFGRDIYYYIISPRIFKKQKNDNESRTDK